MPDSRFLAEGAQSVCGSLIYKNKEVGLYRHGSFSINALGVELLAGLEQITDAVVKPTRTRKPKADTDPALVEEVPGE
jgi:hypothetical protein